MKALEDYCRAYGRPRRIVSDRGTGFGSEKFQEWIRYKGIKHVETAVAYPWANGQMERRNRTCIPIMAKVVDKGETDWANELERVLNNMTSSD